MYAAQKEQLGLLTKSLQQETEKTTVYDVHHNRLRFSCRCFIFIYFVFSLQEHGTISLPQGLHLN